MGIEVDIGVAVAEGVLVGAGVDRTGVGARVGAETPACVAQDNPNKAHTSENIRDWKYFITDRFNRRHQL